MKRAGLLALAMVPAALGAVQYLAVPEHSLHPSPREARLVADPQAFQLGTVELGTRLAYRTTITNHGAEQITLNARPLDCGCGNYSLSKFVLASQEEAVLEGTLDVNRPGKVTSKIILSTLEFPGESLEVLVEYAGKPAPYLPVPNIPLGRSLRSDGNFHVQVPIHVGACSESFYSASAHVEGGLVGDLTLANSKPGDGLLFLEGVLSPRDPEEFGALEAKVSITVDGCTDGPLEVRLLADAVPNGIARGSWPSGRTVVLQREAVCLLPATVVNGAEFVDPEQARFASVSFDQEDSGDASLVFTLADEPGPGPTPRSIDVRVATSRGPGVMRYLFPNR